MPETELLDTYLQVEAEWRKLDPVLNSHDITFKRERFIDSWDVEVQPLVKNYLKNRTLVIQKFFKYGYLGSGVRGTELYSDTISELIATMAELSEE